ncbi:unnamed protein product [Gadus morhua 'NCC']
MQTSYAQCFELSLSFSIHGLSRSTFSESFDPNFPPHPCPSVTQYIAILVRVSLSLSLSLSLSPLLSLFPLSPSFVILHSNLLLPRKAAHHFYFTFSHSLCGPHSEAGVMSHSDRSVTIRNKRIGRTLCQLLFCCRFCSIVCWGTLGGHSVHATCMALVLRHLGPPCLSLPPSSLSLSLISISSLYGVREGERREIEKEDVFSF